MTTRLHTQLSCGVELAVQQLPTRRAQALEVRMLAGMADEPADKLGLAHVVSETLDKGTQNYSGRSLADAFDVIGASRGSWCGREVSGFSTLCLPEHFARDLELHAEFLRRPTFPEESCTVAVELSRQELLTLEDDPQALADKLISRQAYGPVLGRHAAGERETLERITPADFAAYWHDHYCAGRTLISTVGPLEPAVVVAAVEREFAGFGPAQPAHRLGVDVEFTPGMHHHDKQAEQEQIALALPGVPLDHPDHAAETILVHVLAGGMSARLFTEVREKEGLVYWVGAWQEFPRRAGMIFAGASTTPERCPRTYEVLLRELDRVGRDVTSEEIERALAGIVVRADVRGDLTQARAIEQADDLIHYGRPVPWEEKLAKLSAVTVADIQDYCRRHWRRNEPSVVTLGPRALNAT